MTIRSNLMSVGSLTDRGHILIFNVAHCFVIDPKDHSLVYLKGNQHPNHRLYTMDLPDNRPDLPLEKHLVPIPTCALNIFDQHSHSNANKRLWHKHVGHPSFQRLYLMSTQKMDIGLPKLNQVQCFCTGCMKSKQHWRQDWLPLPTHSTTTTSRLFELVHTDLCHPMPIESHSRAKYFMLLIDDYTHYCWICFLRQKSKALPSFKHFKLQVKTQHLHKVAWLCCNRGGEYVSANFSIFLKFFNDHGLHRQLTTTCTLEKMELLNVAIEH